MERVAQIAKTSPSAVTFYFKTKKQLLLETFKWLTAEYLKETSDVSRRWKEPRQFLEALIRLYFDPKFSRFDKVSVWYAFLGETQARKDYMRLYDKAGDEFRRQVRESFTILCGGGKNDKAKPAVLGLGLEGLMEMYWQELLFAPKGFNREKAVAACLNYLRAVIPDESIKKARRRMKLRTYCRYGLTKVRNFLPLKLRKFSKKLDFNRTHQRYSPNRRLLHL